MIECDFSFDGDICGRVGEHRCAPRVLHVLAFFRELLVHTKGDFAGQPFIPANWQRRAILAPLMGQVIYDDVRERYVRKYRTLYLLIARKNGKSELLAGLTLYLLCADGEEGAEIYGLALDKEQAGVVYRTAKRMIELSEPLAARLHVIDYAKRIVDERTGSWYAVIAGDAPGALGVNPHGAYIDELLTQPSRDLYDAIRTGMGTRSQPLLMLATTAENDPAGFAAIERSWSERVAESPDLDERRLVVIYASDTSDDWRSVETWRKANPALGDFLDERTLADECATAVNNPADERAFRQYRLNQPQGQVGRAVSLTMWDQNPASDVDLRGKIAFGGLDLASTNDLASFALDFTRPDGTHDVIWRHFAPETQLSALDRRTGGHASVWARDGVLTLTPGNVIDYDLIMAAIEDAAVLHQITEIGFDPWSAASISTKLTDAGFPMVAVHQGFASLAGPTSEFLRLVAAGQYAHGGNPLARWEASNLVVRTDAQGNVKPDKQRSADKIDGIVAAIIALDRSIRHRAAPVVEHVGVGF